MYDTEMITLQPKVLGKLSEGLICRCEGCNYSHLSLRETSSGPALSVRLKEVSPLSFCNKICAGNSLKSAIFTDCFLVKFAPENSHENPVKSADLSTNCY